MGLFPNKEKLFSEFLVVPSLWEVVLAVWGMMALVFPATFHASLVFEKQWTSIFCQMRWLVRTRSQSRHRSSRVGSRTRHHIYSAWGMHQCLPLQCMLQIFCCLQIVLVSCACSLANIHISEIQQVSWALVIWFSVSVSPPTLLTISLILWFLHQFQRSTSSRLLSWRLRSVSENWYSEFCRKRFRWWMLLTHLVKGSDDARQELQILAWRLSSQPSGRNSFWSSLMNLSNKRPAKQSPWVTTQSHVHKSINPDNTAITQSLALTLFVMK